MRRYLVLPALGVCMLMLAPGASALAGTSSTYYAGTNSQGQKLLFSVDHTASGPKFDPVFTTMVIRCPVTGTKITAQFGFSGFQIPVKNGKFTLKLNDLSDRFSWSGSVTSKKAAGTESFSLAAFDSKGLQDCATGALAWTAPALVPAASPVHAATSGADYVIRVTKAANGSVYFSTTH